MKKIIKKIICISAIFALVGCNKVKSVVSNAFLNENITNKKNEPNKLNIYYRNKKILDLLDDGKKNILFSNTGIESIMEMTRLAAKNETKKEIEEVFGKFDKNLDSEATKLYNYILLNEKNNDKISIKESYINKITNKDNGFNSDIYVLNEENTPEIIADKINEKVEEVTNGLITNVAEKENYEDKDFVSEISNTMYFKDEWSEGPIEDNKYHGFSNNDGTMVTVEYLHPEKDKYLVENEDLIGFTLPYKSENERYYFIGVMPKDYKDIRECSKVNDLEKTDKSDEEPILKYSVLDEYLEIEDYGGYINGEEAIDKFFNK